MCDPPIRIDVAKATLSHSKRVYLLYPAGTGCLKGGRRLDHWRTVVWDLVSWVGGPCQYVMIASV